jgi:16S rRNA processing protein RimM
MQVTVGRIGRPHGIRGDLVVGVRTDEPELRFAPGSRLDTDPVGVGPLTVSAVRWHSSELLVRFEGVNDRTTASTLGGTWLFVDAATLDDTGDPDSFRDTDLVGLTAVMTDGTVICAVDDVLHSGQDVLVIRPAAGGADILVPFVKAIVPEVDVAAGTLVIDPPPGLINFEDAV